MLNISLIQAAMTRLGLNQPALAKLCGVSKEAVSNWLSGESLPRPNKLKVLSTALSLDIDTLLRSEDLTQEPIVAYRTRRNRAVSGASLEAAEDLARHLRELVPFVRRETLFVPPVLSAPRLDDHYIREATRQVRARIGVGPKVPLAREQLIALHQDFGSFLVPVQWGGEKDGHENALSVYLPESQTSWVVFNLNARDDDANYWLAHELGHCYTLHALQDDEGEDFSERFAQELLFPFEAASEALAVINADTSSKERANWYAGHYGISIVTVLKQADRAAEILEQESTGLLTSRFWGEWQASRRQTMTLAEALFGAETLSAEEYVLKSEEAFKTPIFRALAQWQVQEGGRSPAFIASALNINLGQAIELSHLLMKLQGALAN